MMSEARKPPKKSSPPENPETSLWSRTADLRAKLAAFPKTGLAADKEFFDSLSEEPSGDFSKTDMK